MAPLDRTRSFEQAMQGKLPGVFLWESITDEGTYLDVRQGSLHRIPQNALAPGHSPIVRVEGRNIGPFVKLSEDPELPRDTVRLICRTYNLHTNF